MSENFWDNYNQFRETQCLQAKNKVWEIIFEFHQADIEKIIRSINFNFRLGIVIAEDYMSDALVDFYEKQMLKCQAENCNAFRSYFRKYVISRVYDKVRQEKKIKTLTPEKDHFSMDIGDIEEIDKAIEILKPTIKSFNHVQRHILFLRLKRDYSYKEIVDTLYEQAITTERLTEGNVRVQFSNMMKKIQELQINISDDSIQNNQEHLYYGIMNLLRKIKGENDE